MPKAWRFNADSRLIRFYNWCWPADPDKLNFCKLFWGILFSPLAVILHYPVALIANVFEHFVAKQIGPPCPPIGDREAWDQWYKDEAAWKAAKDARIAARKNACDFISEGYHSTKDKTCPLIIVEDGEVTNG